MVVFDVVWALLVALLLTAIFGLGVRREGFGVGLLFFFVLIFLFTWAGGVWIAPVGPLTWGAPWLSFVLVGLVFALLWAAVVPPPRRPRSRREAAAQIRQDAETAALFNIFFWILAVGLLIAIVVRYVY